MAAAPVVDYQEGWQVLGCSVVVAVSSEAISWLLAYRKPEYQRLVASIEKAVCATPHCHCHSCPAERAPIGQTKRREKEKDVPASKGGKNKAVQRIEKELSVDNRDLAFMRMKASVATGFLHLLAFSYIYNKYDGRAVARLPFEPFAFIRHLSHRNVPGDDYQECSVVFLYMLCSICIRPSLQKALGVAPAQNGPASFMSLHQQMAAKLGVPQ